MSDVAEQKLEVPLGPGDWLLQNHRPSRYERAAKVKQLRLKAGWLAKKHLTPIKQPVAVYARARIPKGTLPDSDAIAPMVKAALDGIVDAGILSDDTGEEVVLVGYGKPERDRTLATRHLSIVITSQHIPF